MVIHLSAMKGKKNTCRQSEKDSLLLTKFLFTRSHSHSKNTKTYFLECKINQLKEIHDMQLKNSIGGGGGGGSG